MNRRSILIVLGALAAVAVILAAWFWLFSKGSALTGGFGSGGATNATSTGTAVGQNNIPQNTLPGTNTGAGTNVPLGGIGGGNTQGPGGIGNPFGTSSVTVQGAGGVDAVSGVDWLGGTGTGGSSGAQTTNFTPSAVNQLNDGTTGGQVTILGTGNASPSVDPNYGLLFAAAGAGVALCTAAPLISAGIASLGASLGLSAVSGFVPTIDAAQTTTFANDTQKRFLDCLARTVGRAIVDQITASVVNWINGGFNGSPSFVQNYGQFFANVADQAAGNYIKGSALAFLCSPFQLQVKIAIARSYANRNSGGQCSLTGVVGNVNNFLNGNFSAGGWPGLLQLTSMPTNNPFGAFGYAQIGLATAQSQAANNANRNITPGGFISFAQTYDCDTKAQDGKIINNSKLFLSPTEAASGVQVPGCKTKIATPGSVIESSLIGTQNSTLQQLNLAKSFDEIVSALITQLMTRTLQQGLSNLSGAGGYQSNFLTPDQQAAQTSGNALLAKLQAQVTVAQQYGQVEQGSVADIQSAQGQLAALLNCQELKGQAANATSTAAAIATLELQVQVHNNNVTRANQGITALQNLQTRTLNVTSGADVAAVQASYNSALASGVIITQDDVVQAQQDRASLQSTLSARNQQTAADYAVCQATP